MIIQKLKRHELTEHWLGDISPPAEVQSALATLRVPCEAVWNATDNQWEIYRLLEKGISPRDDTLSWQISAPNKGSLITPGIATWIQKFDTSDSGRLGDEERVDQYTKYWFKESLERMRKYKENYTEDNKRELTSVCKFAERMAFGTKQVVVPSGPIVGTKNGKPVRMYRRQRYG